MDADPDRAGYLLKEGIYLIRAAYLAQGIDKSIRAIEDELGSVIGKEGHTLRKWKTGELPATAAFRDEFLQAAESLATVMIALGRPHADWEWGERFLRAIGHPAAGAIIAANCNVQPPHMSQMGSVHSGLDNIQVDISIKFTLPRNVFYTRIKRWLWALRGMINDVDRFDIAESKKTG